MSFSAIILAAGKGSRMRSNLPKPLHRLGGKPLVDWVLDGVAHAHASEAVVVVPADAGAFSAHFEQNNALPVKIAVQNEPRGTGDAVECARAAINPASPVAVIAFADTPLVSLACFRALIDGIAAGHAICCLGFEARDPAGYGRLITDGARITAIVEDKATDAKTRTITLCNSGLMAVRMPLLFELLAGVGVNETLGEKTLTDIIGLAHAKGHSATYALAEESEVMGINSRAQLAQAEALIQSRLRLEAMEAGATLRAPETIFLSADTRLGEDVIIHPHVVIGGGVVIGAGAEIKSFTHIEGAEIGAGCVVGPYARLRVGTALAEGVKIGNFVETKNLNMGIGAKANHLTYLGDAEIGAGANIGAGTITCNYDGTDKSKTYIGADAFIGSNTALVAPVAVGTGAMIGAGSTITKDVDDDDLVVVRGEARTIPKGAARRRNSKKERKK